MTAIGWTMKRSGDGWVGECEGLGIWVRSESKLEMVKKMHREFEKRMKGSLEMDVEEGNPKFQIA